MNTPWLTIAESLKGTKERVGGENPLILEMFKVCGAAWVKDDETAWCAAFVGACLELSGYQSTNNLTAISYNAFGEKITAPKKGCIVVLKPMKAEQAGTGHVGFFMRYEGDRIILLGGNQSNGVKESSYPVSLVRSFRWPVVKCPVPTGLKYLKTYEQILPKVK